MGAEGKYDLYLENLPKIPDEPEEEPPTDINSVLSDQVSSLTGNNTLMICNKLEFEI